MQQLSTAEAYRLLREAPVAHLGVISEGKPYVIPMSFVVDGERLLFRTKPGRKFSALEESPTVCVETSTFDEETGAWTSVLVTGTAKESDDQATRQKTIEWLFTKYARALGSPLDRGGLQPLTGFPHVIEVHIEEITAFSSGGAFSPRTRPGRL